MAKSTLPSSSSTRSRKINSPSSSSTNSFRKNERNSTEKSDVLVSAVISTYLLTHLHQVLQRAEYGASSDGRLSQAANFAQLRKVLCMDARSMEDASASGMPDSESDKLNQANFGSKVA